MRKLIYILFALTIFTVVNAQMVAPKFAISTFSKESDTVTNTETVYLYLPEIPTMADVAVQPYVTNVSGTITGSCFLQARVSYLNDSSWVTQNASNNPDLLAANDTLTLGNTASTIWYFKNRASRYRIAFVAGGTAVDKVFALYMTKVPTPGGLPVAALATSAFSKTSDTLAASTTLYMTLPVVKGEFYLGLSPLFRRFSGTARTGSAFVQASLGQTAAAAVWVTQNVSTNSEFTAANDTLALAAAQKSAIWYLKSFAYRYRVAFAASTGTQSDQIWAAYFLKPINY